MRWLMIGLLVSLGALLLAAAGMARHIRKHRDTPGSDPRSPDSKRESPGHESDLEPDR